MTDVGIYVIISPSNKVYVGQSWYLNKRRKAYESLRCKGQPGIYRSLNKYGWAAHTYMVALNLLDSTTQEKLDRWETFFYNFYKDQGYVMLNVKAPGSRGKHSEESRKKMSASHANISDETRRKMCDNHADFKGEKHPRFGKKASPELRKKLSEAHKGVQAGEKHPLYGKKLPESTILKKSKPVSQFTRDGVHIKDWQSAKVAAEILGLLRPNISACCRGREKTVGGYVWKYKDA